MDRLNPQELLTVFAAVAVLSGIVATGIVLLGIVKILREVHEIHMAINSRMDELLKMTRLASHAEGVSEEKAASDRTAALMAAEHRRREPR